MHGNLCHTDSFLIWKVVLVFDHLLQKVYHRDRIHARCRTLHNEKSFTALCQLCLCSGEGYCHNQLASNIIYGNEVETRVWIARNVSHETKAYSKGPTVE